MFLNCVNDVECSVFSRDGNVDSETLEKLIISAPESCETLIGKKTITI